MAVQNVFHAQWNEANSFLRSPTPTTAQRIGLIVWDVLSVIIPIIGLVRLSGYGIKKIANIIILPAAIGISTVRFSQAKEVFNTFWKGPITTENEEIRGQFQSEEHTVITPDAASLSVKLVRHKAADESSPTVIYFNGNCELALADPNPWILRESVEAKTPCHFVFFNYRQVGDSKGAFKAPQDLVVDGSSIVQWVEEYLKTPKKCIYFYGRSLGGAVAVQTQALDPQGFAGPHVNQCSFASTEKMIQAFLGTGWLGKFVCWTLNVQEWSVDAAAAFRKLQGQKLVVYHPEDRVIPYFAGLQNEVQHDDVLALQPKEGNSKSGSSYAELSKSHHHSAPLEWHEGAIDRIGQFLFSCPVDRTWSAG